MAGLLTNFLAVDWFDDRGDLLVMVARVLLLVVPLLLLVPGLIWWERRLLSWMQDRIGPNRVGPAGLLQTIADGVKLFFKEDITPAAVDRVIYFIAPAVALFPAFALGGTMPWGPTHVMGHPEAYGGFYSLLTPVADIPIGVLFVMAVSSLGVYGVVLGGYGSNNKYSLLGGLRSSAQLISYELAMGVSLASMVLATGSLRMTDMVVAQEGPLWGIEGNPLQNWFILTPFGFLAGIIFLICMIAETNRAPFDLPEAENELIAGYHTEYSSMKFAVYFMGEYAAMFVFSGIFAAIFLGGYNLAPIRFDALAAGGNPVWHALSWINYWLAPALFLGKMAVGITFYVWLRATLPRLRYDQLMNLGWKSLLPLATFNFIGVAGWLYLKDQYGPGVATLAGFAMVAVVLIAFAFITRRSNRREFEHREVTMVDPSPRKGIEMVDPRAAS